MSKYTIISPAGIFINTGKVQNKFSHIKQVFEITSNDVILFSPLFMLKDKLTDLKKINKCVVLNKRAGRIISKL